MRLHIIFAAAALLPFTAQADEPAKKKHSSILNITCQDCPPLKSDSKPAEYSPPALAGAVQETTIRQVDGKMQTERAEQWLGGAPVRYVSHSQTFLPPEAELMATPDTNIDKPDDGVDAGAQTSAVETPKPLDAEALPLRN